jgi:hypothetical protein
MREFPPEWKRELLWPDAPAQQPGTRCPRGAALRGYPERRQVPARSPGTSARRSNGSVEGVAAPGYQGPTRSRAGVTSAAGSRSVVPARWYPESDPDPRCRSNGTGSWSARCAPR